MLVRRGGVGVARERRRRTPNGTVEWMNHLTAEEAEADRVIEMTKLMAGVLAFLFTSTSALSAAPRSVTASIGQRGGEVRLGEARINIPAGVFSKPTLVKFELLSSPPLPVPAPYRVVAVYRIISDKVANFVPIRILLPPLAYNAAYAAVSRRAGGLCAASTP